MIVNYNVCDFCGNQKQIQEPHEGMTEEEKNNGFEFTYYINDITPSQRIMRQAFKSITNTFCDRDCLIEFLKAKLDINGRVK